MNKKFLFYLLSFLEGGSVMAAELLGAKMLAPFFGASLYVWSSVLAITLGGLAAGYFVGGIVSQKNNNEKNLYIILLVSALFIVIMPLLAKEIMIHVSRFSLIIAIILSTFIFLFPSVFFMGMISPVIVQNLSFFREEGEEYGKIAGTVFAISTIGGIIFTFLLGFWLIPEFGLTKPAITIGILLGIIPLFKLLKVRNFSSLIFVLAVFISINSSRNVADSSGIKILYSSEGMLGQVVVADYSTKESIQRILFVNRSMQTMVETKKGERSFFDYVNIISHETEKLPHGSKVLLIGLGGGVLANVLVQHGLSVDAVELDKRMEYVAKHFFNMSEKVNIIIDDGRHFIKNADSEKKYEAIIIDAFVGESNPHHLFTCESFSEIKNLLSEDGTLIVNGNGFWTDKAGKGMRSIAATMLASGFNVNLIPTAREENYRNMEFIASRSSSPDLKMKGENTELKNAIVLSDEKPQLEILNAEANKQWREACLRFFLSGYYSGQDELIFN